ncbi:hypothetical protein [Bacteroides congonensis]
MTKFTIEQYQHLNRSFNKYELVFHIGTDAGFYSEFNNMVLAIIYCLQYHVKFSLCSSDANFGVKDGWRDYFVPFCDEVEGTFHHKYNVRYDDPFFIKHGMEKFRILLWRMFHKHTYLTSDLFYRFRNVEFERKHFSLPELEFDGNLQELGGYIIDLIYQFNDKTRNEISDRIEKLHLPERYIGLHIRGGDKFVEHKLEQCATYIDKAEGVTDIRKAFVLTDDYEIFQTLQRDFSSWEFYTLTHPNERGYFHQEFLQKTKEEKKMDLMKLFSAMEILRKSDLFVGTFSSNPGMFLGMSMDKERVYGVDFDRWLLW